MDIKRLEIGSGEKEGGIIWSEMNTTINLKIEDPQPSIFTAGLLDPLAFVSPWAHCSRMATTSC